ncbi:MAG: hypothetical protein ACFCBU_01985 [Cyanophyceae cyanobacterium]
MLASCQRSDQYNHPAATVLAKMVTLLVITFINYFQQLQDSKNKGSGAVQSLILFASFFASEYTALGFLSGPASTTS